MVVTSVALDERDHRRLVIAALEDRTVMTELIRQAVRNWLERRSRLRRKGGR